jgi:fatty-acyl-CoA synthase
MITTAMTLSQGLQEVAQAHPSREALVCGPERLTYGELAARVGRLAGGLLRLGAQKGDRVAIVLWPGWEFVVLFFALARLGVVAVPLNPQLRRRQLARVLGDVQPVAVVAATGTGEGAEAIGAVAREAAPGCRLVALGGECQGALAFGELLAGPAVEEGSQPVGPDDLAAILYTSGTTGEPKGVMHSHRGLVAPVVASVRLRRMWLHEPSPAQLARMAGLVARYGLRLLQAAGRPQTFLTAVGGHAIAGIEVMLQALLMGDRLILMPRFHPTETLRLIEKERVTILVAAPMALSVLVRMPGLDRYDLSSLLIAGTGSAPCPPDLARQVQERLHCAIHIGYGMTEVGGGISATSVEDSPSRQAETVGRPMDGMEVRVVDEERRPLPPGRVGELAVRGASRMLGYYGAPELTREVVDAEGWYYTGDLAVMDEQGFIRIVDRKKDVIIRGGQKIYPAEVEQFLEAHPAIREAAVVGVPGPAGDERVWAFVVRKEGGELTARDVLDYCRGALEAYKVPDQVRFLAELPRSEAGKVRRRELRALAAGTSEQGRCSDAPPPAE